MRLVLTLCVFSSILYNEKETSACLPHMCPHFRAVRVRGPEFKGAGKLSNWVRDSGTTPGLVWRSSKQIVIEFVASSSWVGMFPVPGRMEMWARLLPCASLLLLCVSVTDGGFALCLLSHTWLVM